MRILVVDKDNAVTDEDFVFDSHTFADKRVARDFAVATHVRAFLNLNERTNPGAVADLTAVQVDEVMDDYVATQRYVRSDDTELSGHELEATVSRNCNARRKLETFKAESNIHRSI